MYQCFFAALILVPVVHALIGFDCAGPKLNHTTISRLDVEECAPMASNTSSTSTYIQLLQLSDYDHAEVIQCKVKIRRTIYHCGMHSHVSVVHNGQAEYLWDITYTRCLQLHQDGTLSVGNGVFLSGLKSNSTTHRAVTLAGSIGQDGSCSGTQYSDPYGTWDQVVVQATVEVGLRTQMAAVKLNSGKITLKSGTTCELYPGSCIDLEDGYSFWKPMPTDTCQFRQYDVLYEGIATKTQEDAPNTPVVYSLVTQDVTFALTRTSEQPLCGYTLLRTEHPKLFIVETQRDNIFLKKKTIHVDNLDIFAYLNSKFIYVEKHIRTQMTSLYNNVIQQKCRLERQVLRNALALAPLLPDEFAYTMTKGPGYMAVLAGEVIHIIQCIPIEVKVRLLDECYNELPVTYRNESYFLTPKSRILTKYGTVRECSHLLPVVYRIEDTWIRFSPAPAEIQSPQQLRPLSSIDWKYLTPGPLADSGIYSQQDIDRLRDHIMFPAEKPAVLNTIARGFTGHEVPPGGVSISGLLDEQSLNKIAENTAGRLWHGFITFGSASAGVIGIFITIRIVKLVIDTVVHGYTLHSVYGWSLHLIGALWSSITHLLLHLARPKTNKSQPDNTDPEETTTPSSASAPATVQREPAYSYKELSERISSI